MKRLLILLLLAPTICVQADENWEQFKYDSRHSGNAADRRSLARGPGVSLAVRRPRPGKGERPKLSFRPE